jgi:hypothetical protein
LIELPIMATSALISPAIVKIGLVDETDQRLDR